MKTLWNKSSHTIEWLVEGTLFRGRIVLVPFYFGLVIGAGAAGVKFAEELLFHVLPHLMESTEEHLVVALLKLIDLTLIANLLIMVGLASYENFVSALVEHGHKDRPTWLDEVDFSSMKLKMIGSVAAICSIQLLSRYLQYEGEAESDLHLGMLALLAIAAAALILAYADKVAHSRHDSNGHGTDDQAAAAPASHSAPAVPPAQPVRAPVAAGE